MTKGEGKPIAKVAQSISCPYCSRGYGVYLVRVKESAGNAVSCCFSSGGRVSKQFNVACFFTTIVTIRCISLSVRFFSDFPSVLSFFQYVQTSMVYLLKGHRFVLSTNLGFSKKATTKFIDHEVRPVGVGAHVVKAPALRIVGGTLSCNPLATGSAMSRILLTCRKLRLRS